MKIALVCPYDWAKPGGVRAHVADLASHLMDRHEVRIFAPTSNGVGREGVDRLVEPLGRPVPVPYNRSIAPIAINPRLAAHVRSRLLEFGPHVVHVHEPLAPVLSLAATALGPHPLIGTFHSWSDSDRMIRLGGRVLTRVAGRLDERIAVSAAAQRYAAAALDIPQGAFKVVPNGVDADRFAHAEPIAELRDPDRPLILAVGRLERRKGIDVLIRAWLRLRASRPEVRLCVVGEGPERERVQSMVPPALRPDAMFVGAVSNLELPRYHASADVFVSSATGGESFGIVLLEAMAAGLPIVASDIAGYRTVVKDGVQGRLFNPTDSLALTEALEALIANSRLREAMGREGVRTAREYDWSVIGADLDGRYRALHVAAHQAL